MAVTEAGRRELFKRMTEGMGVTIDETIDGLALIILRILALAKARTHRPVWRTRGDPELRASGHTRSSASAQKTVSGHVGAQPEPASGQPREQVAADASKYQANNTARIRCPPEQRSGNSQKPEFSMRFWLTKKGFLLWGGSYHERASIMGKRTPVFDRFGVAGARCEQPDSDAVLQEEINRQRRGESAKEWSEGLNEASGRKQGRAWQKQGAEKNFALT